MDDIADIDDSGNSDLDYWRLCDELTVVQAALLVVGVDPAANQDYVEEWAPEKRPRGYEAAKAAICRALFNGSLDGQVVHEIEHDRNGDPWGEKKGVADVGSSIVLVISLKQWLLQRGIKPAFFFPFGETTPGYLDPAHPRYSNKLAATVRAWQETANSELLRGKSPKQALEKWLRENASRFELTSDDGSPNEKGIEECAKVANWRHKGGAPKTPE